MDAWASADQSNNYNVYMGLWTDWPRGRILGSTLTITKSNGALVIAFAAFFATIVAARFWRMLCVVIHHVYSRFGSEHRDVLYHQRQAILRNSPAAISGLWSFVQVCYTHRYSTRQLFISISPIVVVALLSISAFTALTYFLPQITTSGTDEVLLIGDHCGQIYPLGAALQDYNKSIVTLDPYLTSVLSNAENYASQCYTGSSQTLQCSTFIEQRIPTITNNAAECPFHPSICRLESSNIKLDTGLLSFSKHFGVNNPATEDVSTRQVVHCAPLTTEGYTSSHQLIGSNVTRYHYGSYHDSTRPKHPFLEATAQFVNVKDQIPVLSDWGRYNIPTGDYKLLVFASLVEDGALTNGSEFRPIPYLHRDDADLMLVFLLGAGVLYTEPSPDPWYRATTHLEHSSIEGANSAVPVYIFDEAASPLGCALQYQLCITRPSKELICGNLASFNDAESSFIANAVANATNGNTKLQWHLNTYLKSAFLWDVVNKLGALSLTAHKTLSEGGQRPIPNNQWQLDVAHWWATRLAALQATFVNTAIGPPDSFHIPREFIDGPTDSNEKVACNSQKIRSAAYTSFNMLGLSLFFGIGTLIVTASLLLEPLLAFLHKCWGYQQHAYLEWVSQETLQLQRLAHEELGFGTWSGATDAIPTTKLGEKLADLDLSDPEHPKLRRAVPDSGDGTTAAESARAKGGVVLASTREISRTPSNNELGSEAEADDDVMSHASTATLPASESTEPGIMARASSTATGERRPG
ncbi:hypothetical protein F4808DRAFT_439331 [Astrocystis sublimbata]|nr:hypothetical protein F4808DRAFT_439331 [Astrocystis sublimbata]